MLLYSVKLTYFLRLHLAGSRHWQLSKSVPSPSSSQKPFSSATKFTQGRATSSSCDMGCGHHNFTRILPYSINQPPVEPSDHDRIYQPRVEPSDHDRIYQPHVEPSDHDRINQPQVEPLDLPTPGRTFGYTNLR